MPEITVQYDGTIKIATGRNRKVTRWNNQETQWGAYLTRLSQATRTAETAAEYAKLGKAEQADIKDVGGFVAGTLKGGRRQSKNVISRSLVTLDADYAGRGFWETFAMLNDCAACVYSTHKHSPEKPRLRLILPLSRQVSAEEYKAIAHRIAGDVGIEQFDDTTYDPTRLMYWPSTSQDAEYVFEYQDGPWVDADEVLARYHDWRDVSEWPESVRVTKERRHLAKLQGDPLDKPGLIGAFCRAYTMTEAIEKFLQEIYMPTEQKNRYTYTQGSTAGGLIIYDDKFAYSHHGTDPAAEKLLNAFDLVRLHLFGERDIDESADAPTLKLPSYAAMLGFVRGDEDTLRVISEERQERIREDFGEPLPDEPPSDPDWEKKLEMSDKGGIKQTIENARLILENEPQLRGAIWYNGFTNRRVLRRSVPWRKLTKAEQIYEDADDAGLRHFMESAYKLTIKTKIDDAVALTAAAHTFHPVREYLDGLHWDGVPRVETLLPDYLGAEDCDYTRTVTRKTLAAAVARVYEPGIKFDTMLILTGPQGIGKSLLLAKIGRQWYSDSLSSVAKGKDSYEQLQGYWLLEMGELNAMRKQDAEDIKGFLSKSEDVFRVAYGKHTAAFPRQCIFFGTTNSQTFLSDPTGNRRFFPVDVGACGHEKHPWDLDDETVGQIWAEAKSCYLAGEELFLTGTIAQDAKAAQGQHVEDSPKMGVISEFLERRLPEDWYKRVRADKRTFLFSEFGNPPAPVLRTEVCIGELWSECFGKDWADIRRPDVSELHTIMQQMPGWELVKISRRFGEYGAQRLWYRRTAESL